MITDEYENEIARLHRFIMSLANRLANASEVLGHLAERKRKVNDYLAVRSLSDGRIVTVMPLVFGRARLTVGAGLDFYDDSW